MEIVSPDSVARDWREKFLEYQRAGVREYCVLDVAAPKVEAYLLSRNDVYQRIEETTGKIQSRVLSGFFFRPRWLVDSTRPRVAVAARELSIKL